MVGDGDRRSEIEAMIREQDLADRIRLASSWQGWELMAAFDIFVMPSRYEAMPYVLLEALSTGLPVVTTRVSGSSLTVKDGENGLIVPNVDDPEPLAAAIERLAADPELRCAMAEASRRRVARFQLATMVRKTLELYIACLRVRNGLA
jgi:glycosyltransferase involved in cell wall biosynthesis